MPSPYFIGDDESEVRSICIGAAEFPPSMMPQKIKASGRPAFSNWVFHLFPQFMDTSQPSPLPTVL